MRLLKVALQTAQPEAVARFYDDLLGQPGTQTADGYLCKAGHTELLFMPASEGTKPFYHFAFNIPANKMGEAKEWLRKKASLVWIDAYQSEVADFTNWHAQSVYFFDPGGNLVELIARFDLNNASDLAFDGSQLLGISEIGVVCPESEIEIRTAGLMDQYGIPYFFRQPPFANFKALGNDEGLLIVVTEGRHWFPTQIPAGIFPLKLLMDVKGKAFVFESR